MRPALLSAAEPKGAVPQILDKLSIYPSTAGASAVAQVVRASFIQRARNDLAESASVTPLR